MTDETPMEQTPRFCASQRERIAAFLILPAAYLYAVMLTVARPAVPLAIFAVIYVALAEYLAWGTPRTKESWFWLGCMLVILAGMLLERNRVWDEWTAVLFVHLAAGYWALCRSGRLTMGKSSRHVLLDGLNAFLLIPFGNLFLRIRCVFSCLSPQNRRRTNAASVAAVVGCVLAAVLLFIMAVGQLSSADATFQTWVDRFSLLFSFRLNDMIWVRLVLTFPVAAYVFGLLAGILRKSQPSLQQTGQRASDAISHLHQVPNGLWSAVLLIFCLVYAAFFALQGQYLFGAFRRCLPEGFTVAQYARQGFFELCKVAVINLVLYWCVTRSGKNPQPDRLQRILLVVLLAESMLFAVIALSKLGLYISCFGFTPKRLQSCWLASSLLVGGGCTVASELTGKKTIRLWMFFSAATLSLLHLF